MSDFRRTGRKLVFILIVVFLGLIVINQPVVSGQAASDFWHWLNHAANSVSKAISNF